MNSSQTILESALPLKPYEKFYIIEGLLQSLDEPNKALDKIWAIEAEKRLDAHRSGKLKGIPMTEIFNEKEES
ncbi:addiction module protein [Candidatus Parabeggiatoa sp. HSG14]|uniref:addiction module protein n=1 Tax=Candidatus Parabeggiatoa sp. HSG14 TaxID=3055593 RepID=UPI0025A6E404|nr:addiction module protein [Thiotrichales bacterium HSG14]